MYVSIENQKLEVRKAISSMSRAVSPETYSAKKRSQSLMRRMDEIVKSMKLST